MKYIIVYLICFFIFLAWLFYEQRKAKRIEEKMSKEFWAREAEANQTRKKDISQLPLVKVAESELPLISTSDEAVLYYIGQLREIIKEPMIDLSEYTNTDLKLAYGVGNFKTLSDYDEKFNSFLVNLTNLARSYAGAEYYKEAKDTYQMALRYGSKKVNDYTELANIYLKMDQPEQITKLIADVKEGDHPRKESIIESLRNVLACYQ